MDLIIRALKYIFWRIKCNKIIRIFYYLGQKLPIILCPSGIQSWRIWLIHIFNDAVIIIIIIVFIFG